MKFRHIKDEKSSVYSNPIAYDIFSYFKGDNTRFCSRIAYCSVGLIIATASVLLFLPLFLQYFTCVGYDCCYENTSGNLEESCSFEILESIPENLTFPNGSPISTSIYDAWMYMLSNAKTSVDIVSFYWTMRGAKGLNDSSDWQGEKVFQELLNVMKRGVKLRVIVSQPQEPCPDIDLLAQYGAQVEYMDSKIFFGSGVLHTKLWIVDKSMMFLGSANMDWRSLTQVKELGVLIKSCDILLSDAQKLVDVYHYAATHDKLPSRWPCKFKTNFNIKNPMHLQVNGIQSLVYLSSSPSPLCPYGRTEDLEAILNVINSAEKFVYISVMDYSPSTWYMNHNIFWPIIDNALRKVIIEKRIKVKVLASLWVSTRADMIRYLKSLASLDYMGHGKNRSSVEARLFCVPIFMPHQRNIKYSRVNHDKYMVTDQVAYIGTSNWVGDYFITTSGVGIIINQTTTTTTAMHTTNNKEIPLRQQLESIFVRDWYSNYSLNIWDIDVKNFTNSCNSAYFDEDMF